MACFGLGGRPAESLRSGAGYHLAFIWSFSGIGSANRGSKSQELGPPQSRRRLTDVSSPLPGRGSRVSRGREQLRVPVLDAKVLRHLITEKKHPIGARSLRSGRPCGRDPGTRNRLEIQRKDVPPDWALQGHRTALNCIAEILQPVESPFEGPYDSVCIARCELCLPCRHPLSIKTRMHLTSLSIVCPR